MDALQERVAALNALALRRPRPDRLAQVRDGLEDKFEGVQSAAIKVLGAWGDTESCKLLRTFLVKEFDRRRGWSVRGVAIKALVSHISEGDVDWVFDLYFGPTGITTKHELCRLCSPFHQKLRANDWSRHSVTPIPPTDKRRSRP